MNNSEHVLRVRTIPTDETVAGITRQLATLDAGAAAMPAQPTLSLPSVDALFSLLTPRRVELLSELRQNGPMSIRSLAKLVQRDHKNVHGDTVAVIEAGLAERDANGQVSTPWDRFEVHLPLQDTPFNEAA